MLKRVALSVVALFAICIGARAQETASSGITGQVLDTSKAGVPGATITITNLATNAQRVTQSDSEGRFSVPNLPPATYSLKIELSGFQTAELKDLTLRNGEVAAADADARRGRSVGDRQRAGRVAAPAAHNASVSQTITEKQIEKPARCRPQPAGLRVALGRRDAAGVQPRHAVRRGRQQPQPVRHGRRRPRQLDQLRDRRRLRAFAAVQQPVAQPAARRGAGSRRFCETPSRPSTGRGRPSSRW